MKKFIAGFAVLSAIALLTLFWRSSSRVVQVQMADQHAREEASSPKATVLSGPLPVSTPAKKAEVTDGDRRLVKELEQILASRNDNDPRLDTDLRHLSPGTKELLMQKYQGLPMEARNDRGTIVFLIGRELNRPEDFEFLSKVADEAPCLSLRDCKKAPSHTDEDVHEEAAISVTLAYPQHVAVKSLENYLSAASHGNADSGNLDQAMSALSRMTESPVGPIARKASELRARFSGGRG